jgi:hypothetical protein
VEQADVDELPQVERGELGEIPIAVAACSRVTGRRSRRIKGLYATNLGQRVLIRVGE